MATPARTPRSERSVDRLVSFSDGVVAVAITLLALPLVDLLPESGESAWDVVSGNSGPLVAFVFTFAVVAIMWSAHNRVLNGIVDYDAPLFWLNVAWLAGIVLLPWFSNLYGATEMLGTGADGAGAGAVYWSTLAFISLVGWGMSVHLRRHPELEADRDDAAVRGLPAARGLVFAGWFLLTAIVSVVAPGVASWLPLGIIALSIWLRPTYGAQERTA